ncbi:HAD-IA family hydrolase [Roseicyclus sp. F158]|uniref:HAD-IA family hydrolase n=1 Tax=Tropicimonas omnivorans TaxID=3075590 RepID=A0ABU3DH56_9RHOB|nr:HAD-IA family hydrolase [Roseicyclus sp. F158]MDT0683050.1 HAD-IA family hydrolase [Roseicyclus sp. F158]
MTDTREALVLDFGGVISRTLFETHDLTERSLGLPPGTLTWQGPFAPEGDALWSSMQAGGISERDYYMRRMTEVGGMVGEDWTEFPQFIARVRGDDPAAIIRPEFLDAIARAKAGGKRLTILSNELDLFYGTGFRDKLPFLSDFELIVDATYTGILKPDPGAFAFVTDGLGLPASSCVFVDDQLRNIRGGETAGMACVHFDVTAPGAGYAEALRLLGL